MELIRSHEKLTQMDEIGRKSIKEKLSRAEDIVWHNISEAERIGTSGSDAKSIYTDRLNQKKNIKAEIAKPLIEK